VLPAAAGHKDRDMFISGKNKQNAVKSVVVTDSGGRLLFCSPAEPASCADTAHAGSWAWSPGDAASWRLEGNRAAH
jgi:hypothetical protein